MEAGVQRMPPALDAGGKIGPEDAVGSQHAPVINDATIG